MEGTIMSENEPMSISSSPDFAQAYIFVQTFGSLLKLPLITLSDFEDFFAQDSAAISNQMVLVHWRLLNTSHRKAQVDWQRSAILCARRFRLCNESVPYFTLPAQVRLKLFRLCCEDQFDYNVNFKSQLTKEVMEGLFCKPLLGYDSSGQRLWLLKDLSFDIRLYGECEYDVVPPKQAKWVELARTLEGLAEYTAKLESTRGDCLQTESRNNPVKGEQKISRSTSKKSRDNPPVWDGDRSIEGCIKCRKDSNHSQMLLCDECDRECHTYCQYPRLWRVPKGKWSCPICKEGHLIQDLKKVYTEMSVAKSHHDTLMKRKEKSIARLQRTGLLVQNIILEKGEEEVSGRSRRSRKEINYAELNDVQLPPLGRGDYVGCEWSSAPIAKRKITRQEYIYDDYLAPRIRSSTRRFRGSVSQELEANDDKKTVSDKEERIDVKDDVMSGQLCTPVTPQSTIESGPSSPHQSNGGYSIPHDPLAKAHCNSSTACSTESSSHDMDIITSSASLVGRETDHTADELAINIVE